MYGPANPTPAGAGCHNHTPRFTLFLPTKVASPSLETGRAHAARSGLDITYLQAAGEDLPFPEAAFDIVYCCDVLEHVNDLDCVIAETARVLKAGKTLTVASCDVFAVSDGSRSLIATMLATIFRK